MHNLASPNPLGLIDNVPGSLPSHGEYERFLQHILVTGRERSDRTGVGTKSVFGYQMRFALSALSEGGFLRSIVPLICSKFVPFPAVLAELLWILSGSTNNNDLRARGCTIWDEWARENGDLGPIYGKQWRSWYTHTETKSSGMGDFEKRHHVDQIDQAIHLLKTDPTSRRIVVSAWNPADLPAMALSPCHALFQFYATPLTSEERRQLYLLQHCGDHRHRHTLRRENWDEVFAEARTPAHSLSCQLYQRSADAFLGVPFNIASYALLTHMIAAQVNMVPAEFIWTGGDCHLYSNHYAQAETLLSRDAGRPWPTLEMHPADSIDDYTPAHFKLSGYDPHPKIVAQVAI